MIRNIVFDIGWVFVALKPQPILDYLKQHGASASDLDTLVRQVELEDHETGRLDGEGLLERMSRLAPLPHDREELRARWASMLVPQPDMIALAQGLSAHYRVYLLSNIGDLHWNHLERLIDVNAIGHGALASYQAGVMKPAAGIYAQAEQRFGLEPGRTVFIDDRKENIEAARIRGWHGIIHRDIADTRVRLTRLGVEIPS